MRRSPGYHHELSALSMDGYALAAGGILVQVPEEEVDEAKTFLTDSKPVDESGESSRGEVDS